MEKLEGVRRGSEGGLKGDMEGLFTGFAENLGGLISETLQEHMEGVQGKIFGPLSQQAKEIEEQIQNQIDDQVDKSIAPGVNLAQYEKSMERLFKRYPHFGDMMAAKNVIEVMSQGPKGGGNRPHRMGSEPGGQDF